MNEIKHVHPEVILSDVEYKWFSVQLEDNDGRWWQWQGQGFAQIHGDAPLLMIVARDRATRWYYDALTDARAPYQSFFAGGGRLHLTAIVSL